MTRRLNVTDNAQRDFETISAYVFRESGSREVADTFIERLTRRCEYLAGLPGILGTDRTTLGTGFRSISVRGYLIFFRYRDDVMEIIHVVRSSRNLAAYFSDADQE